MNTLSRFMFSGVSLLSRRFLLDFTRLETVYSLKLWIFLIGPWMCMQSLAFGKPVQISDYDGQNDLWIGIGFHAVCQKSTKLCKKTENLDHSLSKYETHENLRLKVYWKLKTCVLNQKRICCFFIYLSFTVEMFFFVS